MSKLSLILITIFSMQLMANDSPKFTDYWNSCPADTSTFYKKLQDFDASIQNHFDNYSTEVLVKIYGAKTTESQYLRFYAPYLLPSGILAEFDKSCWAILQDGIITSREHNYAKSDEKILAWKSCVETNYKTIPKEVATVFNCRKF